MSSENASNVVRVALDAMGGDFAPENEVVGGLLALQELDNRRFELVFVGRENEIKKQLASRDTSGLNYSIVHADDVVTMHDDPAGAFKKKRNSSLFKGVDLQANGYVDAFVSAGNTGAVMSVATLGLGRIKGVGRPTIGSFLPTAQGGYTLLLDVGATVDAKAKHLYEFAVMGSIYSRQIRNIENPKIGLLNIGEEASKGTEVVVHAFEQFSASNLNFVGNVEGRDVLAGAADVIVCDGFTGNIVLKFAESFLGLFKSKLKTYAGRGLLQKLTVGLMAPVLRRVLSGLDYQDYGGVPLLGVNGVVIIGHGSSSARALKNMILLADEMVQKQVNKRIENALNPPSLSEMQYEN